MAGNQVNISVITTDKTTDKVLNRLERGIDKNEAKLAKLGRTGNRAGKQVKSGFDSSLATFGKFAGAITGVGSAVGGVALAANQARIEIQRFKDLNQTDADKQVVFQDAISQAIRNANGLFGAEELKNIVLGLEEDTGVAPAKIADTVSSAISARGATNKKQAQDAIAGTRSALIFAPELNADESARLAGSGIDISKKTGFSSDESIGFVQNVGSLARVEGVKDLAQNVAPAVNGLLEFNNTAQEAGSLIAALTQGTKDFTGAMSRTASINLAKQIEKRGIGGSTTEGIKLLQEDPQLRKRFLEGGRFNGKKFPAASIEANAFTSVRSLLTPDTDVSRAFSEGTAKIGGQKEAKQTFDFIVSEIKKVTPTSTLRRESKAASDAAGIKDVEGGRSAEVRNLVSRAFDDANFSSIRKQANLLKLDGSLIRFHGQQDPRAAGIGILEEERQRLLSTSNIVSAGVGAPGVDLKNGTVTKEERASADALERQIEILLKSLLEDAKNKQTSDLSGGSKAAADAGLKVFEKFLTPVNRALESIELPQEAKLKPRSVDKQGVQFNETPATFRLPAQQQDAPPQSPMPFSRTAQGLSADAVPVQPSPLSKQQEGLLQQSESTKQDEQTKTALETSAKAMQQASNNMNGREILDAINKQTIAIDNQTKAMGRLLNQNQDQQGRQVANNSTVVPPPRRPAYKSPAERLSVSSNDRSFS